MDALVDENPTRKRILNLLKKNVSMSVGELSHEMDITHMAVRQQLMHLEKNGNVRYEVRRSGVGRPVFLYSLTSKAGEKFPRAYGEFLSDALVLIEEMDGRKKVEKIFKARGDLLARRYGEELSQGDSPSERLAILAKLENSMGAMVEVEAEKGHTLYRVYNCLIQRVAERYPEACEYDAHLYKSLLGSGVSRSRCQMQGSPFCEYIVPVSGR
jgi:predicted ArsR family transcriptional regulator